MAFTSFIYADSSFFISSIFFCVVSFSDLIFSSSSSSGFAYNLGKKDRFIIIKDNKIKGQILYFNFLISILLFKN